MNRPLFLHEVVDITGPGTWAYLEHTLAAQGDEKVNFRLVGTFAVMGITGRWPQAVNLWEVPGGWDGWRTSVDRLNLERPANRALEGWWKTAYEHRSGGFDRLLGGAPGCPSLDELVAAGVRATLFVHELATVRPGTALDYLAAVRDERAPVLADYGHRLVGLYETLLRDDEVCLVWATDVDAHVGLQRARDAARGLLGADEPGDERLVAWEGRRRAFDVRGREELMTPCPGIAVGPPR